MKFMTKQRYCTPVLVECRGIVVERGFAGSNMESVDDESPAIEW